ncbi:MAG: IS1 family transposase, partial [Prevotellaceae bacterium]|nr:IS1 family transposase [Prevotellaceae bacterium]
LDYAVVHKTRENGRIVKVEKRIVFGDEERIKQKLLQSVSSKINTAYIERSNGTLRQLNSHLRRKSLTFAK